MKHIALCLLLAALPCCGFAQTKRTIEAMAARHQACLDEGTHMLQCARSFNMQMDSMLNVTYNNLRKHLDAAGKEALKKEQLAWLQKRDRFFEQERKEYQHNYDTGEWGPDMYMVVYDNEADFVKARVLELVQKLSAIRK